MKKTAVQQLIEDLKQVGIKFNAEKYIAIEKQQIIDAGNGTLSNWHQHDCERHGNKMPDGEQYYSKTFKR